MLSIVVVWCLVASVLFNGQVSGQGDITRIINGKTTTIEQVPYIVQIRETSGFHFCGGTLVSSKIVITAAHCFNSRQIQNVLVVAGSTTVSSNGVSSRIAKLHKHPDYSRKTSHSDIAILELDQALTGPNIRPIPLCQKPLVPGQNIKVSDWGRTVEGIAQGSTTLRTVDVPIRSMDVCTKEFAQSTMKNMFCASGLKAMGTCFGDSGGPAVVNGQLCGIVAFGYKCGAVGRPAGFTNVYDMRGYIKKIVGL